MATIAQSVASQANARHSTGPRTAAGKARVSQNAFRHGLTARHLVIRDDEHEEFAAFQDSLLAELDPQGAIETVTFHELLHAAWNLQRFRRIEAELAASGDPLSDPQTAATADRLARYQARTQRAYYRAIHELRTLQTNRALRAVKLDGDLAGEVPAITDINELTKQTQSEVTAKALALAIQMVDYEAKTILHNLPREKRPQTPVGSASPAPSENTPTGAAR
jgi:hypothetical protein